MIEETGIVTKVDGVMAKVSVQKKGFCEGCAVKGACESTGEGAEVEAFNTVQAKVGDTVRIAMKPQTYLKGTMLVYGLPLVLFIAGAIIGKNIGEGYFKEINSDIVAAATGFSALIVSLLGIKIWSKKLETNREYMPVIEKIIN